MKAKCLVAMEFSRTHTCSVPTASPMPGRAAERADLVTELDGTPVRDAADLQLRVALLRIGGFPQIAMSRPGGAVIGARRFLLFGVQFLGHRQRPHLGIVPIARLDRRRSSSTARK